jgi:hypothetical protein
MCSGNDAMITMSASMCALPGRLAVVDKPDPAAMDADVG